ncbi:hypothetical protein HPB51_015655 [Rhipicephalus microplus]|uniref:Uncharacterized protein n=1 Tax=Rhipicephalus microplus TaxID=6941 RepID=A0A9J6D5G5_RHIMP|nr:hypothetical protein HPB51_015655 [Rhipicephalus microplus]
MAAPTALALQAASSNAQLTRTLERLLEEAQHTGDLKLNGRKLKELPTYAAKYDLRDIVHADLSKNRLSELPTELCGLVLLERLDCHSNVLRVVPACVSALQALSYLDLSTASSVQSSVFEVEHLVNMRQMSVSEMHAPASTIHEHSIAGEDDYELGARDVQQSLYEVGQVTLKPVQHKHRREPQQCFGTSTPHVLYPVKNYRNQLSVLPVAVCHLPLAVLLVSNNRLSKLPEEMGKMRSLMDLRCARAPISQPGLGLVLDEGGQPGSMMYIGRARPGPAWHAIPKARPSPT